MKDLALNARRDRNTAKGMEESEEQREEAQKREEFR